MNHGEPRKSRGRRARPKRYTTKGALTPARVSAWRSLNPRGLERLLWWLAAPLMFLLGCASPPPPDPAAAVSVIASAEVVAFVDYTGERYCGGVAIGPTRLLTAAHCLRGGRAVAYMTEERWRRTVRGVYWAEVERIDAARDLAWLRVRGPWMPAAPAGARLPRGLEPVQVTGAVSDWATSAGVTTAPLRMRQTEDGFLVDPAGDGVFWTSDLTIRPGWSGAPVIALDGALVGVIVACTRRFLEPHLCTDRYAIFTPVSEADLRAP